MADAYTLDVLLRAKTEGMGAFKEGENALASFAKAGAAVGLVAGGAMVVGLVEATKSAGNFQQKMTELVTGAGESTKAIGMVSDGILKMAASVGQSPEHLASAMYMIESAGYHGAEGLKVLQAAAEGARVGNANLATVGDALTSVLNAYNLKASDATRITSAMMASVRVGKMHMDDFAGSLGKVLPIAAALNIPFEQISGAMATMTTQGTDAATATTSLRFLMAALAGPTKAAAHELAALGIGEKEISGIAQTMKQDLADLGVHTSDVAAKLASGDLPGALAMITDAIGKKFPAGSAEYEAALKAAVGGTRGLTAALELTGPHAGTFLQNVNAIGVAARSTSGHVQGWGEVTKTFNFQMDSLKESLSAAEIEIGTKLIPVAERLISWFHLNKETVEGFRATLVERLIPALNAFGDWFVAQGPTIRTVLNAIGMAFQFMGEHMWLVLSVGAIFLAFMAAWAISNAVVAVCAIALGVAELFALWPIALLILAFAAVIVVGKLLHDHWDELGAKAIELANGMKNNLVLAFGLIRDAALTVLNWLRDNWQTIVAILIGPIGIIALFIFQNWDLIKRYFYDGVDYVRRTVQDGFNALAGFWSYILTSISGMIQSKWDAITNGTRTFIDTLRGFFEGFGTWIGGWGGGIASAIGGAIHGGLDGVRGVVNAFVGALHNIPVLGGALSGIGPMPGFASGGIVNVPTAIVGEGGPDPEYVIPTDRKYRSRALALFADLGTKLMESGGIVGGALKQMGAGVGSWGGQCVPFVEQALGVFWPVAAAAELTRYINTQDLKAGLAAVFTSPPYGHVALTTGGSGSDFAFPVIDSNWVGPETIGTHVMNRGMYGFSGFIDVFHGPVAGTALSAAGSPASAPNILDIVGGIQKKILDASGLTGWPLDVAKTLVEDIVKAVPSLASAGKKDTSAKGPVIATPYDTGGILGPGQLGINLSNANEHVVTGNQLRGVEDLLRDVRDLLKAEARQINVHNYGDTASDPLKQGRELVWALKTS